MNVINAIRGRRSIRDFKDRPIPDDALDRLIEALIWAPSAGNFQSRKFYFVKDPALKRALASAALGQSFIAQAPIVVVGCADNRIFSRYGERGVELYAVQDVSLSLMSMMLAAFEEGLGSVWVGAFKEKEASKALGLPDNLRPVAIVPLGYPSKIPAPPPRVEKSEAVEFK